MKYANAVDFLNSQFWAILPSKLDEINAFADQIRLDDIKGEYEMPDVGAFNISSDENELYAQSRVEIRGSTAIVPITGTIMPKANMVTKYSGGTSTELLTKTVTALGADNAIKNIVFKVDSPGGAVVGMSEAVAAIRAVDKKTVAVAEGGALSAAYWLASAADEFYATQESLIGSIGVIASRLDVSEAAEGAGIKRHVWRSGPFKALGNFPEEPVGDREKDEMQGLVDGYYQNFLSAVQTNRNLSDEEIVALGDGKVYLASQATSNNMIDGISTVDAIVAGLDAEATADERFTAFQASAKASEDKYLAKITELQATNAQLQTEAKEIRDTAAQAKAEAAVEGLVAAGKIGPKADTTDVLAAFVADFEGTTKLYALVPEGAAAPQGFETDDAAKAEGDFSEVIAKAKAEGKLYAESPEMAEVFRSAGKPFVVAYAA